MGEGREGSGVGDEGEGNEEGEVEPAGEEGEGSEEGAVLLWHQPLVLVPRAAISHHKQHRLHPRHPRRALETQLRVWHPRREMETQLRVWHPRREMETQLRVWSREWLDLDGQLWRLGLLLNHRNSGAIFVLRGDSGFVQTYQCCRVERRQGRGKHCTGQMTEEMTGSQIVAVRRKATSGRYIEMWKGALQ